MPPRKGGAAVPVPEAGQLGALGVERIFQYAGQEQVDLALIVDVPGSWFGAGSEGGLAPGEKKEKYAAQAVEYAQVHEFKKPRAKSTKEQAIRFICTSDAQDDGNHDGFWMPLTQWNRYRHDTYKDNRQAELPFIRDKTTLQPTESPASAPAPAEAGIFEHFELVSTGKHKQVSRRGDSSKHRSSAAGTAVHSRGANGGRTSLLGRWGRALDSCSAS